jgi:hypothetical protein
MEVSCWSFIRMGHLAEPLMKNGGSLFTMTYYGSHKVVKNYNIMQVAGGPKQQCAYGGGARSERHSRARDLAGAFDDARCIGISGSTPCSRRPRPRFLPTAW